MMLNAALMSVISLSIFMLNAPRQIVQYLVTLRYVVMLSVILHNVIMAGIPRQSVLMLSVFMLSVPV
jgi:hypothetical protein